jgi:hypothetical protein
MGKARVLVKRARATSSSLLAMLGLVAGSTALATVAAAQSNDQPDFTGVWGNYRGPDQTGRGVGAPREELPLTGEARAKLDAYAALVTPTGDTPGGVCLGTGMPGSMLGSGGYPMEIVQHDDLLIIVYEAHAEIRRIYIADELRTDDADLFPDRNGYSVGRWNGHKLMVETTHLKAAVDQRRYPHSAQARVIEEYELVENSDGSRVLTANMTLVDPDFYTETIETQKQWSYLPGVRLLPYECNEPAWDERLDELKRQQESVVE